MARSAGPFALSTTPCIRAQNDFFRPSSALVFGFGAGAFKLLPVAALYLARPLAVSPAPALVDNFSPRPTDRLVVFRVAIISFSERQPCCRPSSDRVGRLRLRVSWRRLSAPTTGGQVCQALSAVLCPKLVSSQIRPECLLTEFLGRVDLTRLHGTDDWRT